MSREKLVSCIMAEVYDYFVQKAVELEREERGKRDYLLEREIKRKNGKTKLSLTAKYLLWHMHPLWLTLETVLAEDIKAGEFSRVEGNPSLEDTCIGKNWYHIPREAIVRCLSGAYKLKFGDQDIMDESPHEARFVLLNGVLVKVERDSPLLSDEHHVAVGCDYRTATDILFNALKECADAFEPEAGKAWDRERETDAAIIVSENFKRRIKPSDN